MVRMPKSRCRYPMPCPLCSRRIRAGMWMGKDFELDDWAHVGCLVRKLRAHQEGAGPGAQRPVAPPDPKDGQPF
jgi:hypothetical protein